MTERLDRFESGLGVVRALFSDEAAQPAGDDSSRSLRPTCRRHQRARSADRPSYFIELRGKLLARLALDTVAAANHFVLATPPKLGPAGIDMIAREIATPLREGTG